MSKIYASPIPPPTNYTSDDYDKGLEKYEQDLVDFCKKRNPNGGEHIGSIIRFPVADGSATYVVANLKPIELIHSEALDAYEFNYVDRLTKADILAEIKKQKMLKELFDKHNNK